MYSDRNIDNQLSHPKLDKSLVTFFILNKKIDTHYKIYVVKLIINIFNICHVFNIIFML